MIQQFHHAAASLLRLTQPYQHLPGKLQMNCNFWLGWKRSRWNASNWSLSFFQRRCCSSYGWIRASQTTSSAS